MTSSSDSMTCEACREALTELVCGELDAAAAAKVREHVTTCRECAAQLARFSRVMEAAASEPLDSPAPRVREHVMREAREALTRRTAPTPPALASAPAASAGLRGWLERLGHWAMSPQVAMATVLLLVVGIGIYALPFGRKEPRAALTPALDVHPTEGAESAAATTAPGAEAEPQKVREDLLPERAEPSSEKSPAPKASSRFAPKPERRAGKSAGAGPSKDELDDGIGAAPAQRAKKKAEQPSTLEGAADAQREESERAKFAPPPAPVAPRPAPVAPKSAASESKGASPHGAGAVSDRARSAPAGSAAQIAAEPSSAEEAAPVAEARAARAVATVEEGVRLARAGDASGAIRILLPWVSTGTESERQTARLWLARSYRASGDCKSALAYYEPLTARNDAASSLLNEAADCHARLGNEARASALRARAKGASTKAADEAQ